MKLRQAAATVLLDCSTPLMGKGIAMRGLPLLNSLYWRAIRIISADATIHFDGMDLSIPCDSTITPNYERETQKIMRRFVRRNMVVVDIGAHVGIFTLLMAKQVGEGGKVYAIEPDPRNQRYLKKNIRQNRLRNVSCHNVALSSFSGLGLLYQANLTGSNSLRPPKYRNIDGKDVKGNFPTVQTEIKLLDEVIGNDTRIDFVKMDIEGGEIDALHGMVNLIKKNAEVKFIIEYNPRAISQFGYAPGKLFELFWAFGFKTWTIDHGLKRISTYSEMPTQLCNLFCARDEHGISGVTKN